MITLKKNTPTFAVTFLLQGDKEGGGGGGGGLNHMICHLFSGPVSGILNCGCNLLLLVLPGMWGGKSSI